MSYMSVPDVIGFELYNDTSAVIWIDLLIRICIVSGRTKIVLLGTGTPNADPARFGPSVAIVIDQEPYLFDFGPGLVRRAAAAHKAGIDGLAVSKLTRAFVTHLHSDHTIGFADLILTPWVLERQAPLKVYGPIGICEMADNILKAYHRDIKERIGGLEPANTTGFYVNCHEIEAGKVFEDSLIRVEAFEVNHGSWDAFGYRVYAPDRIIVLSGDTAPFDGYEEAYGNCDVLIHEVYSSRGFERRSEDWQEYHASMHTSTEELVEIATRIRPGLLILNHQLFFGVSEEEMLLEVKEGYKGKVVSGKDLEVY
jgi:ribonuclease BN (tRNA processing enzyme)